MTSEKSSVQSSMACMSTSNKPVQGYTTRESVYFAVPTTQPAGTAENKEQSVMKKPASANEIHVADTDVEPSSSVSGVSQIQKSTAGSAGQDKSTALVAGCTSLHKVGDGPAKSTHTAMPNSMAVNKQNSQYKPGTTEVITFHSTSQAANQSKMGSQSATNTSYFALPNQPRSTMSAPTVNAVPANSAPPNKSKIDGYESMKMAHSVKNASGKTAHNKIASAAALVPVSFAASKATSNMTVAKTVIPSSVVPTPVPSCDIIQPVKAESNYQMIKPTKGGAPSAAAGGAISQNNKAPGTIHYVPVKTNQYTVTYAKPAQPNPVAPAKIEGSSVAAGHQNRGVEGYHSDYVSQEARNAAVKSGYVQPTPVAPKPTKSPGVTATATTPKPSGNSIYQELKPSGGAGNSNYQELKPSGGAPHPNPKPTGGSGNSIYQELTHAGGSGNSNYEELKMSTKGAAPAGAAKKPAQTDAKFYENLTSYESLLKKQEENK